MPPTPPRPDVDAATTTASAAYAALRSQFERLPAIAYRCKVTPDWPMEAINSACEAITGWPATAFLSGEISFGDLIEPEHQGRVWRQVQEALDTDRSFRVNYTIVDRHGRRRVLWEQGHGVRDADGTVILLEGLIFEIKSDQEDGDALSRNRHFVERVLGTMPSHVSLYDLDAERILYTNGIERSSLRDDPDLDAAWRTMAFFVDRLHPEDRDAAACWARDWQHVADGEVIEWHYRISTHGNDWSWRSMRSTPFERDAEGRVRQVLCISVDITAQARATQALADSEQRHRMIMEGASDGVFVADRHLCITDVNPAGCSLLQMDRSALIGLKLRTFFAPEDLLKNPLKPREIKEKGSVLTERRARRGDGTWCWLEMHSRLLDDGSYLAIVRDLTARKEAEEERLAMMRELMEAQRLESLGLISSGIAHDFNNLLATIMGSAEVALHQLDDDAPSRARLERIQLASRRASDLTRQLLDYVGRTGHEVEAVQLDALLQEIPLLIEASLGADVAVIYAMDDDVPTVQGDRGRLQQLAMNLIVNASEAIGAQPGVIHLRVRQERLDAAAIALSPTLRGLATGRYVIFEVEDDGCGIDPDQVERIFEPFFSTKGTGRGLGLAAVHGIVSSHGGAMRIDSVPQQGTRVRVWLPAQSRRRARFHSGVWATGWQGVGRVLLVDDEDTVRAVLSELVETLGFAVESVSGGQGALDFLATDAGDVAVVLLDVTMPSMDGVATWRRITAQWPDLPVVFMSGMAAPDLGSRPAGGTEPGFLLKPFSLDKLRQALQDATGQV